MKLSAATARRHHGDTRDVGPESMELLFCRDPRVLLVRYDVEISRENFRRLDNALADFVGQQGTADTIIDFSGVPTIDFPASVLVERGRAPSRMPGRRRVFVVRNASFYGMFRLYGTYQDDRGVEPPLLVRSLEEALAAMGAGHAVFAPV